MVTPEDDEPEPALLRALGAADVAVRDGRALLVQARSSPEAAPMGFEHIDEEVTAQQAVEALQERVEHLEEVAEQPRPPLPSAPQVIVLDGMGLAREKRSSAPPSRRGRAATLGAVTALLAALGAAAAGIAQCASETRQTVHRGHQEPAAVAPAHS